MSEVDRVFEIFAYFDSKAGDVLLANHFVAAAKRRGWNVGDLQQGIDDANKHGWIEAAELGWRLTQAGFAEMMSLDAAAGRG